MGKLFVVEGTDGSGKQTQVEKLQEKLREKNIEFKTVSFPNYESASSSLVKMYLSGEFGSKAECVNPYVVSTFFAVDRFATFCKEYKEFYDNGGIIIADRYTTANMIHQACKIDDIEERNKFLNWLTDFEFQIFGLPKPNKVFLLNMPTEFSIELMSERDNKFSHSKEKDIHEKDKEYLSKSYKIACELANKYDWCEIKCVNEKNEIRTIEDISNEIFGIVQKELN